MDNNYNHLTAYLRIYTKKANNVKFPKLTIKGQYIPKEYIAHNNPIKDSEFYQIRLVGDGALPAEEGKYRVYFPKKSAWVDERSEGTYIIRMKGDIQFEKISGLKPKTDKVKEDENETEAYKE